ncbi:MAG: hypothetical protein K0U74_11025 [Alphaproteobacteria bacterium]|nr:hypothetical protein [Alphaproteobacteria bacterium]
MKPSFELPTVGEIVNYIFGRNALIGWASLMLLAISGYATWSGMNDFIVGVSQSPTQGREIAGGLSVTNEALVIAIVVALTFLMWLALRETFGEGRTFKQRLITFPLYFFLALWSIGFGYGFWWSLIAGEEATRTSLSNLQEDARDAGTAVSARLEAVKAQLDGVVSWSETQMTREETSGGSCGISSGAGQGPLYNARKSVRDAVANLRDGIQVSWLQPVERDLEQLKAAAQGLEGATFEERQKAFEAKAATVRSGARRIAARSNELGSSTAAEMRALAQVVSVAPGKLGFSCYDPTLAQRLNQAAEQADQPVTLNLRTAEFTEGPAGVANAVKRLWENIGAYAGGLVSFVANGFKSTAEAGGTEGISGRDLIALLATLGIDLGLFVLAALNPPPKPAQRILLSPAVKAQIREAMETAIARAPNADMEWVRSHFLYHNHASYFVIPNLFSAGLVEDDNTSSEANAGDKPKEEQKRALAMNQLAGVFDDLDLVRWPTKKEFIALKKEEELQSLTDLTKIRKKRLAELEKMQSETEMKLDPEKAERIRSAEPVRNHGLFSKAERLLEINGWTEKARNDIEIYRLVDIEGLTPILDVLNENTSPSPAETVTDEAKPTA